MQSTNSKLAALALERLTEVRGWSDHYFLIEDRLGLGAEVVRIRSVNSYKANLYAQSKWGIEYLITHLSVDHPREDEDDT